ncbi:helix-turn-helix domain-containing protein [Polymorphobacter sp. PAMC 29334]|uniref:helix-turn-helix domain-containing protein n=1 Tax=Polymorphobacter sp. PAMC 29334 TaxID=2862331 RepID=UPI001D008F33|nr:helix-turn-helix domain-containing protein [Polymorphobacter sp. PAMC 29334]
MARNVRELRNFVARATALHPGALLDRTLAATLLHGEGHTLDRSPAMPSRHDRSPWRDGEPIDLKAVLDEVEQAYIRDALGRTAGGIAGSARLLGLRRTTLIEKMRRLQIERPVDC